MHLLDMSKQILERPSKDRLTCQRKACISNISLTVSHLGPSWGESGWVIPTTQEARFVSKLRTPEPDGGARQERRYGDEVTI